MSTYISTQKKVSYKRRSPQGPHKPPTGDGMLGRMGCSPRFFHGQNITAGGCAVYHGKKSSNAMMPCNVFFSRTKKNMFSHVVSKTRKKSFVKVQLVCWCFVCLSEVKSFCHLCTTIREKSRHDSDNLHDLWCPPVIFCWFTSPSHKT